MAHTAETYRKIHRLIEENVPYRLIAQEIKVTKIQSNLLTNDSRKQVQSTHQI